MVGLSIGVSKGTRVEAANGYGLADVSPALPAGGGTVYRIGSITKEFTAAAIMQLVQHGRLRLDDRLDRFVSGLPYGSRVSIADLLDHTSGIVNETAPPYSIPGLPSPAGDHPPALSPAQMVRFLASYPLSFSPGTKFSYSNSDYFLLGLVIERASGESYGTYLRRHLLSPLGLSHTGICPDSPRVPGQARGYYRLASGYSVTGHLARSDVGAYPMADAFAAGDLCSNVSDLVTWSYALAHGGVVSAASYAKMATPTRLPDGTTVPYGYGLEADDNYGRPAVRHTGSLPGFDSLLVHFNDSDLSVAILIDTQLAPVVADNLERQIISALVR